MGGRGGGLTVEGFEVLGDLVADVAVVGKGDEEGDQGEPR